ncbi:MAG TPA: BTAD domain-containing putative transcriptional regulator [Ilumatobacteraceae bacterium]|nr:BTAD domain-containing putative transcriptional regulator [Ilumatobacteraceae bacterium]
MTTGPAVWLFGAVTLRAGDRRVSAGPAKQCGVLAVLALNVGRPVTTSRLIDSVWGDDPPHSVGNAIQVYVSALRKLVAAAGLSITRAGATYTLVGALDDVDVQVFERLAAEGRAALRSRDLRRAGRQLDDAYAMFDAAAFAGLDDFPFVVPARAALLATGLAVAVDRGAALCSLGHAERAVAMAEGLVDTHPFHEPAWEMLMRALYHAGRQSDALHAYERARTTMLDELGLDPSPRLVGLERQILDQTVEPPMEPPIDDRRDEDAPRRRALPEPPSDLVGRHDEIDRIVELAGRRARLITLVGLGGIGKTSTALAAASRLAARGRAVAFADLAAVTDAAAAMQRVGEAAGMGPSADAVEALVESDPDVIVIADNAEQVVGLAAVVASLLASTTRLTLIVTSRIPLQIRVEHTLAIAPLDTSSGVLGDAGRLFVQCAARVQPALDLTDSTDVVRAICDLAGGIPLALEIAAGRLGHLSPAKLLERLQRQRATLLDAPGAADLPDRQHSLRTVLEATFALITDESARLVERLSVVKGPVSLEVIDAICADEPGLAEHVEELVRSSLASGPDSLDRYRLLPPVADFAESRARDPDRDRDHVARAVLDVGDPLVGQVDQAGVWAETRLIDDAAAVTAACAAALERARAGEATRLAATLRRYWLVSGRFGDGRQFCSAALRLDLDPVDRARVQLILGQFAAMINDHDTADLLKDALGAADTVIGVEPHLLLNSWCYLGSWMCSHDDLDGARDAAARVEAVAASSGDAALTAISRDFAGYVATHVGDFETAYRHNSAALADARRSGDRYVVADLLNRSAENLLNLGRGAEADDLMNEAMDVARTTAIGPMAANVLLMRAAVDLELDRPSSAIGGALEALRLTTNLLPDPVTRASALRILGAAQIAVGDLAGAARCDGAAAGILTAALVPPNAALLETVDRRLRPTRDDPDQRAVAEAAARNPSQVVDDLLADSERLNTSRTR